MYKTNHYTITRENLPLHEMMGLHVEIVQSTDHPKTEIHGIIVDETQRTFRIETKKGEKTIPKNESTFVFDLNNEKVTLEGKKLLYSPIERLKNGGKILYA